jgi:apolipoprotein N-acyltransferase
LTEATPAPTVRIGIESIDDFIGTKATAPNREAIWRGYEDAASNLARQGARIVVLPEKIESLTPNEAADRKQTLARLARKTGTYLVVGVQLNYNDRRENVSWLVSPQGELATEYHKQHMVPYLEHDLTPGTQYVVRTLEGSSYGLAICKDLTFADFGRAYGKMGVAAMLVPAWDFSYRDAWMASEIAAMRGVENGYSVVRAGRESYLQASDRYGRVVARERSAYWPGSGVVADVPLGPATPTVYSRTGDAFGWTCVVAAVFSFC